MIYVILKKDFIIKVQTMSTHPPLSVFGTVSMWLMILLLEQKLEASGTFCITSAL